MYMDIYIYMQRIIILLVNDYKQMKKEISSFFVILIDWQKI